MDKYCSQIEGVADLTNILTPIIFLGGDAKVAYSGYQNSYTTMLQGPHACSSRFLSSSTHNFILHRTDCFVSLLGQRWAYSKYSSNLAKPTFFLFLFSCIHFLKAQSKSLILDNPKPSRGHCQIMFILFAYSVSSQHFHILGPYPHRSFWLCVHTHAQIKLCSPSKGQRFRECQH